MKLATYTVTWSFMEVSSLESAKCNVLGWLSGIRMRK